MQLRLREIRTGRGRSQEDVAQHVGVKAAAVGKWERGENHLRLGDAVKIVTYLDCTLDDLAGIGARELSAESRQHQELERAWAKLGQAARRKLLDYARLLAQDEKRKQ